MDQQIEYYSLVYQKLVVELGLSAAQAHLSKSLFTVVIGSNDIFGYHESSDLRKKYSPQQYVESMASTLKSQLKVISFLWKWVAVISCNLFPFLIR